MGVWQGRFLTLGGRLILTNSSLTNIPLYMLSLYKVPRLVLKRMDFFRTRFLWQESQRVKKYHLVNWQDICRPKDQGGLGMIDPDIMNKCLLSKWLWRLENSCGIWQDIIKKKYLKGARVISAMAKKGDSQFWKGLMEAKDNFCRYCSKEIGNEGQLL